MNILKKFIGNRNMIRLPRKLKKRYKKEFAGYIGTRFYRLFDMVKRDG